MGNVCAGVCAPAAVLGGAARACARRSRAFHVGAAKLSVALSAASDASTEEGSASGPSDGEPPVWRAFQGNELVDQARLEEICEQTWELDRYEAEAWTLRELDAIQTLSAQQCGGAPLPATAAHRLWRGTPDAWKAVVWTAVCGGGGGGSTPKFSRAVAERYERALANAFGDRVPRAFERCPSFDGGRGKAALQRLLWCCSQLWSSQLEFCPVLPVVCVLLLVFCESEAAAYSVVSALITKAVDDWSRRDFAKDWEKDLLSPFPVLPLSLRHWAEVASRVVRLLDFVMPDACKHLRSLGVDLEDVTMRALSDGLASQLPFRAVCRAYGAFLAEGMEVFVRWLVVLWRRRRKRLLACVDREDAVRVLLPPWRDSEVVETVRRRRRRSYSAVGELVHRAPCFSAEASPAATASLATPGTGGPIDYSVSIDDLARYALELRLPKTSAKWGRQPSMCSFADFHCDAARVFCRPRLHGTPSRIVWDELWPYLWAWLPRRCRIRDPVLCFAAHSGGYSLSALMMACAKAPEDAPMLLAVHVCSKDGTTGVLGAFLPAALRPTGGRYIDITTYDRLGAFASSAYIFRVIGNAFDHDRPLAWHWTGRNNLLVHAPASDPVALQVFGDSVCLCVGGDAVALSLDQGLRIGRTSYCSTFDSPPLLPHPSTMLAGSADHPDAISPDAAAASSPAAAVVEDGLGGPPLVEEDPVTPGAVEYQILDVEVFELD